MAIIGKLYSGTEASRCTGFFQCFTTQQNKLEGASEETCQSQVTSNKLLLMGLQDALSTIIVLQQLVETSYLQHNVNNSLIVNTITAFTTYLNNSAYRNVFLYRAMQHNFSKLKGCSQNTLIGRDSRRLGPCSPLLCKYSYDNNDKSSTVIISTPVVSVAVESPPHQHHVQCRDVGRLSCAFLRT